MGVCGLDDMLLDEGSFVFDESMQIYIRGTSQLIDTVLEAGVLLHGLSPGFSIQIKDHVNEVTNSDRDLTYVVESGSTVYLAGNDLDRGPTWVAGALVHESLHLHFIEKAKASGQKVLSRRQEQVCLRVQGICLELLGHSVCGVPIDRKTFLDVYMREYDLMS